MSHRIKTLTYATLILLLFISLVASVFAAPAPAAAQTSVPTLTTDKADYAPGEVVQISGVNFAPNTRYAMPVMRPDGSIVVIDPDTHKIMCDILWGYSTDSCWEFTTSDSQGNLAYSYQLDGILGTYEARAYPESWQGDWNETPIASVTFTDGPASLDQCANGAVGGTPVQCADGAWVNGNLNGSKAHYVEGDSIPYRLLLDALATNGTVYSVAIEWDTTEGGDHTIDYITSFNRTETDAVPCPDAACLAAGQSTAPIPVDPKVAAGPDGVPGTADDITQIPGVFTLFGGTITSVSPTYFYNGDFTGNSQAGITLNITANIPDPVLAWGGHIATRNDWTASAIDVSGASYHMRFLGVNGQGGNQDRAIQSSAIIFPAEVTVIKNALPDDPQDFTFTTDLGPSPFTLDDDADPTLPNSILFDGIIDFGAYSVTEQLVSGWDLTSLVCTETDTQNSTTDLAARTASLVLEEGEYVTCTFTNSKKDFSVTKTAEPTSVPETGDSVTYTVRVDNTGFGSLNLTSLTDDQFGNITDPTNPLIDSTNCAVPQTIIASDFYQCKFTATISGDYPGSHTNVVTAVASDLTRTDDATVTFTDVKPDITVTKTASPITVPESGGSVIFTFTITNNSPEAATITALSDDKFGTLTGDADCQVGTVLAGGESCSFQATFPIPAGDYPGSHVNTFTATVTDGDGNNDSATDNETVEYTDVLPDISVTKTANITSVPETGGDVTFTFAVTNNSLESATITALSDDRFGTLAGDADCQVGTVLNGGASCSFSAVFSIPVGDYPGSHVNTFTATVTDGDGNNDSATDNETVEYTDVLPDITVTKTANITSVPETGGDVTFTFTVTNNSLEAATITALSDDQYGVLAGDADCQIGTVLNAGASCSFFAVFTIPAGNYLDSHINTFTATVTDGDGNNDSAMDDAEVSYTDVLPDIAITKDASPTAVPETGANVEFTIVVTNNSLEDATITSLIDTDFDLSTRCSDAVNTVLASGETYTCTFIEFISGVFGGPDHVNTATVVVSDNEGNQDNASDDATVTFARDLGILNVTKDVEWGPLTPDPAQNFEICITGPSYLNLPNCKTIGYLGGLLTWENLVPGDYTITETDPGQYWSVVIDPSPVTLPSGGATVASNVTNTFIQAVLDATKADALHVDLKGDGEANAGDTLRYTVVITNTGPVDAQNVVFTDTPGKYTSLVVGSVTTSQGTVTVGNTAGDTTVQVDLGTILAPNGQATVTFDVVIDDPLAPEVLQVENQGLVTTTSSTVETSTDDPDTEETDDPTITPIIEVPTAITLQYFRVESVKDFQVELAWGTAAEIDNFGFYIYRSDKNDPSTAEAIDFISSVFPGGNGYNAEYSYVDTVPHKGTWWYWLVDVDTSGVENWHMLQKKTLRVSVGMIPRLFLPIVVGR